MKTIPFFSVVFFSIAVVGQNPYIAKMKENLSDISSAKGIQKLQELAASFERVAEVEKTEWLPYYYAALCIHKIGQQAPAKKKDAIAEKAIHFLKKAQAIENNAELYCLEYMLAILQMTVDPPRRYLEYGSLSDKAAEKAKEIDPSNPRIYLMEGFTVLNKPAFLGGGKANAKPLFEKALALLETSKPPSILHPVWGKDEALFGIKVCDQ